MEKTELIKKLFDGIVTVEFTKVNGDYRKMNCTLNSSYLPEATKVDSDLIFDEKNNKSKDNLSVWDIDANGWRSFRWNSLQGYSIESA